MVAIQILVASRLVDNTHADFSSAAPITFSLGHAEVRIWRLRTTLRKLSPVKFQ